MKEELNKAVLQARILVVDDQPVNVKLMEKMLQGHGFSQVVGTTDPTRVESMHRESPFDLILLDIRMPVLDGFEVMGLLHKIDPKDYLPILVMTAQTDQETKMRALNEGAKDFLYKPFDQAEAISRIRNILEVRLLHNQVRDHNKQLEERVAQATHELQNTQIEIVRRLGRAAEFRDNETGMHVIRMSKASGILARHAGLAPHHCELIENAAPMHDVGKIGIPDTVLLKPGPLDQKEWEVMQSHTLIGWEILSGHNSALLNLAAHVALTHHEKWDGTGYPKGLKGEEIPLEARIITLCDVLDALTSVRPYKKAWTMEEAILEIESKAGTAFDPSLAPLVRQALPEIKEIWSQYRDGPPHKLPV